jgi:hypothetical protein
MPRLIKYKPEALNFLLDLNSSDSKGYARIIKVIHRLAKTPALRGSVLVNFSCDDKLKDGRKTLTFTQCRHIDINNFNIVYTWSDDDNKTIYITAIEENTNLVGHI